MDQISDNVLKIFLKNESSNKFEQKLLKNISIKFLELFEKDSFFNKNII